MDCSIPGLPVHQQLPEFAQTHVHWVSDAIQPSHLLSSPSPPAFNLSQHQGFSSESALHIRWQKYWSFSFNISPPNEYSGLISFRMDLIWIAILKTLGQRHDKDLCLAGKILWAREVCLPKLREMPKGHILSLEVLKLCFSQCHKVYVLLYFSLLTYLMRRMRDLVPRLEWKGRVDEKAWLFSLVAQSCPTLCNLMNCSMPDFLVHHQLPESAQNSCPSSQWCHPTISSSVVPFSSCLQSFPASGSFPGLFQWVSSSYKVAKVLEFQLQHQSFQWTPRTDLI